MGVNGQRLLLLWPYSRDFYNVGNSVVGEINEVRVE